MRIEIEGGYLKIYNRIIKHINLAVKGFKLKNHKVERSEYEKLLFNTEISAEKKKDDLARKLHELIIKTFSIETKKFRSKKAFLESLKHNIAILRALANKLRAVNYYLEESLLKELGMIKKYSGIALLKGKNPEKILEKKAYLNKKDMEKLDYTIYKLMDKVIFFDKKLIKGYKKTSEKLVKTGKTEISDIEKILKKESEILTHIEAKLPPPKKIKADLLKDKTFQHWVVRIFALLAGFEHEYEKEKDIFTKLKKKSSLRKKINKKIKDVQKEKERLLKIKEQRALSIKKFSIDKEWRNLLHQFNASAGL